MKYSFKCPMEGCSWISTVDAQDQDEALSKLSALAGEHVKTVHPEFTKTDEEVRSDVSAIMKEVSPE